MLEILKEAEWWRAGRVNVVVVNDFAYVQGGASRVAIDDAFGLAELGINVIFFAAVGPVCPELIHPQIRVILLGQLQLSDLPKGSRSVFRSLWNLEAHQAMKDSLGLMNRRDTVVHVHGYTKALTASVIRAATDRGFKVICTLHDFFSACPNGAFYNFVEEKICPLTALSTACITTNCDKRKASHKAFRVVRSMVQKTVGRFPSSVENYIALSDKSASVLSRYLPAPSKVRRRPNAVSVPRHAPVNVASNPAAIVVGRLEVEKGIATLVDAARAAETAVTFVGDGPLRAYAETLAGTRVTGWLDRSLVMQEIEKSRCLVFPSLWYETFGLVVEEAAARGVPSIVSDVSAAAERVVDGLTGWHFRSGDAVDLARCLRHLADDGLVARAGSAAYSRYWNDPPTPAKHTQELLATYHEMLAAGPEENGVNLQ